MSALETRSAQEIVALLELERHPEGGWFRETWRAQAAEGERSVGTAIYFLLQQGQVSHWHRVDADEIWHWHAGAPLTLSLSQDGVEISERRLGPALFDGERPQVAIPKGCWQSAESLGDWTLVGCTVSPAFEFEGFELAAPGWRPGS